MVESPRQNVKHSNFYLMTNVCNLFTLFTCLLTILISRNFCISGQCAICKTTCFLSALTSLDNKETGEIVCLRHFKSMECEADKLVMRYRYFFKDVLKLQDWFIPNTYWLFLTSRIVNAKF